MVDKDWIDDIIEIVRDQLEEMTTPDEVSAEDLEELEGILAAYQREQERS